MNLFKRVINQFFLIFGYRLVQKNREISSPAFQNLVNTYEYLFQQYRNHELIPTDSIRASLTTRLLGTSPSEAYFIIEAIARTKMIPGDVCEFGVAQGETSALIANEIQGTHKKFHLFDSFEGLPRPSAKDKLKDDIFNIGRIEAYEGTMKCNKDMVIRRLEALSFDSKRYILHEGFIEELIREKRNFPQKVSFAYIDFDFYEPILITLNFLHDVLSEGGICIVDDYDYFSTGVKTAIDEFVKDKNKNENFYDIEIPDKRFGCFVILYKNK